MNGKVVKQLSDIAETRPHLSEMLQYAWEEQLRRVEADGSSERRMELIRLEHRIEGAAMDEMDEEERTRRLGEVYRAARELIRALNLAHPQDLRWLTSYGNYTASIEKLFEAAKTSYERRSGVPTNLQPSSGTRPRWIRR